MEVPSVIILLFLVPAMSLRKDEPKLLAFTPCHEPSHSHLPHESHFHDKTNKVLGGILHDGKVQLESTENKYENIKAQSGGKLLDKFYPEVDRDVARLNDSDSAVGFSAMREYAAPFLRALLDDVTDDAPTEQQSKSGRRGLLNGLISGLAGPNSRLTNDVKMQASDARNGIEAVIEIVLTYFVKLIVRTIMRLIFGIFV